MILDKAIKGIKILDLTRLLPGPLCTGYLSDMGAEIIKNQKESGAPGIITGESACYSIYETKDHLYMALGAMEKKFWIEFCERVGKQDWAERHPGIGKEFSQLQKDLKELVGSKTQSEWSELFKDGVACFTPVKEVEDSYLSSSCLDFPL